MTLKTLSFRARGASFRPATFLSLGALLAAALAAHADSWETRAPVPGARAAHSAVWTGNEMIVFGGGIDGSFLNTGGRFLAASNTWRVTSLSNAPSPRWFHAAVWTGNEMLVWGGRPNFDGFDNRNDGGRYNPVSDTWRPINTSGAPTVRSQCAAVWTGTEMIIWGGATDGGIELNDGAKYNPQTDSWSPLSSASGLSPRMEPAFVWTGSELIVFGGMKFTGGQLSFGDGASYNPARDSWKPLPAANAPSSRTGHTAVWTGSRMLVWGGRELPSQVVLNTGASYDPRSDSWTPLPVSVASPGRMYHAAVWTGTEMIVWGGQIDLSTLVNTGARWHGTSGAWTATTQAGAPGKRQFWRPDLGVWTGDALVVAAGSDYPTSLDSTHLYRPAATNAPPPHAVVYDVSQGYSTVANPAEPWSHGWKTTIGGAFSALPYGNSLLAENGVPIFAWQLSPDALPSVAQVIGPGTAISASGQFVGPPGTVYFTAGGDGAPQDFGAVRFTVPAGGAGNYRVETSVRDLFDGSFQGDTDFHVARNGVELFGQFLPVHQSTSYSNVVELAGGDTVDFLIGRGRDGHQAGSGLKLAATLTLTTHAPPPGIHCAPLPNSIVAWWPAEGNPNDVVGTNRGALSGSVSYAPGMAGTGFTFPGTGSPSVKVQASPSLNVGAGSGLTIEGWIKPADFTHLRPLVEWNDGDGGIGAHLWVSVDMFTPGDGLRALFANLIDTSGASHQIKSPPGLLVENEWQHVAVTYDKATGRAVLYRDGAVVASQDLGSFTAQTSYPLYLGERASGPFSDIFFSGGMDEFAIYGRALSAAEFRSIASAGSAGKCRNPATLEDLIHLVRSLSHPVKRKPLLASVEAARASIARGNLRAAIHQLEAFQKKVRAHGSRVDPALAEQLIQLAQQIIEGLDPTGARRAALAAAEATPLHAVRLVPAANGTLRVEGGAVPGTVCCVQRSTNLEDWEFAGWAVEVDDGVFEFVDPLPPTGPARFYRLLEP